MPIKKRKMETGSGVLTNGVETRGGSSHPGNGKFHTGRRPTGPAMERSWKRLWRPNFMIWLKSMDGGAF
jgi:hypothetical protein